MSSEYSARQHSSVVSDPARPNRPFREFAAGRESPSWSAPQVAGTTPGPPLSGRVESEHARPSRELASERRGGSRTAERVAVSAAGLSGSASSPVLRPLALRFHRAVVGVFSQACVPYNVHSSYLATPGGRCYYYYLFVPLEVGTLRQRERER